MAGYAPESGGGRAGPFDTSEDCALFKPYELEGLTVVRLAEQANEMLTELYGTNICLQRKSKALTTAVATLNATVGAISITSGSQFVTGTLTDAQIKALSVTPVVVIATPGAGYMNLIKGFWVHIITATVYNTSQNVFLRYTGSGANYATSAITGAFGSAPFNRRVHAVMQAGFVGLEPGDGTAPPGNGASWENNTIEIVMSGALTLGGAGNSLAYLVEYITRPIF